MRERLSLSRDVQRPLAQPDPQGLAKTDGNQEMSESSQVGNPIRIEFGSRVNPANLTSYSRKILEELMWNTGVQRILISSLYRSADDQARIMFNNIEKYGVAHQLRLYGKSGDIVIGVYDTEKKAGKSDEAIKAEMAACIRRIGPERLSMHCVDPRIRNAIDIAPSSIPAARIDSWQRGLHALWARHFGVKVIFPPRDPAYHIEIPQP